MDRRLKERLVGATLLVVLIILVVPELLSGPKRPAGLAATSGGADSMRNVRVDLATRRAAPADDQSASAPPNPGAASAASPPPGADSGNAQAPDARADAAGRPTIATLRAQQPADAALEKASSDPTIQPSAPNSAPVHEAAAVGSKHGWAVQIGSFASRANAEKEMHHLKALNESAYLLASGTGRTLRYKVRVGPFAERSSAEKAIANLKKNGESANLIPP